MVTKKAPKTNTKSPRKLKTSDYRSFRLQKKIKPLTPRLPGSLKLLKGALNLLMRSWKPILGIALVYTLLNVVFLQNFSNINLSDAKASLEDALQGNVGQLISGFSLFAYLVGSSGSTNNEAAGAYKFILLLITSLAIIWTLRQVAADKLVRVRDGFYQGMYPLVPFVLVFCVVALQLLPLAIGTYLYSLIGPAGVSVMGPEWLVWGVIVFLLAVLSLYMLSSSLFALYIVCLPGMQPMAALRSARKLVRYRRWTVMRRILFLPIILFVLAALAMVPVIIFVTPFAVWIFFLLTMLVLPLVHSYMYKLYRELLRED